MKTLIRMRKKRYWISFVISFLLKHIILKTYSKQIPFLFLQLYPYPMLFFNYLIMTNSTHSMKYLFYRIKCFEVQKNDEGNNFEMRL
jgi:hypothetical protein